MSLTLSGTNGVVGAGFTVDASGVSVTAGVGTFGSLAAPAAGLTGALPAISAASLTQIPAANIVGVATAGFGNASGAYSQGITMADQWRITAGLQNSGNSDFSANWERVDTNIPGFIGEGMTESSGVFTFPSTGIYLVRFVSRGNSNQNQYIGSSIYVTSDNGSSYGTAADSYDSSSNNNYYFTNFCEAILDITDTSNQKVKFTANTTGTTATWNGSSSSNETAATFIRLGDT